MLAAGSAKALVQTVLLCKLEPCSRFAKVANGLANSSSHVITWC